MRSEKLCSQQLYHVFASWQVMQIRPNGTTALLQDSEIKTGSIKTCRYDTSRLARHKRRGGELSINVGRVVQESALNKVGWRHKRIRIKQKEPRIQGRRGSLLYQSASSLNPRFLLLAYGVGFDAGGQKVANIFGFRQKTYLTVPRRYCMRLPQVIELT